MTRKRPPKRAETPPAPQAPLRERDFQKLSQQLSEILTSAQNSSNEEKTAGYWDVGARIAKERLSEEAGYHNAILRELARALGVSARTLRAAAAPEGREDANEKMARSRVPRRSGEESPLTC